MTQTLGEEIIVWIETLRVPEGALVGQPLVLMDWQKREILRIYDNPAGTRRAIISVGRKSGKSSLCACLMLAHLAGPVAVPNSQLFSTAQSRDQAALLYALAAKIVRMSARQLWGRRIAPSAPRRRPATAFRRPLSCTTS
jgi:phage terminase large subunit-like protein